MLSRKWHAVNGGVSVAALAGSFLLFPSTYEDAATVIGVVGSVVTVSAAMVAFLEILRLESLAAEVSREVDKALKAMRRERMLSTSGECQALIDSALTVCDEDRRVPAALINRILRMAAPTFQDLHETLGEQDRDARNIVRSYAGLTPGQQKNTTKLRAALTQISSLLETTSNRATK